MSHILNKKLKPWNLNYNKLGQFYQIDVTPYIDDESLLLSWAYIYVPNKCIGKQCHLHIYMHGCSSTAANSGTQPARKTGLLEHASTNNFVVLFPQAWDPEGDFGTGFNNCW